MSKVTSVGAEEFVDLIAFVAEVLVTGVNRIDNKNDLHESLPPVNVLEGGDGLRDLVIHESEVLLLKTAHWWSRLRSHDHVKEDLAGARLSLRAVLSG